MLEFCCNSDDVRYYGEFNFHKKEGTYYVHIIKKKILVIIVILVAYIILIIRTLTG